MLPIPCRNNFGGWGCVCVFDGFVIENTGSHEKVANLGHASLCYALTTQMWMLSEGVLLGQAADDGLKATDALHQAPVHRASCYLGAAAPLISYSMSFSHNKIHRDLSTVNVWAEALPSLCQD